MSTFLEANYAVLKGGILEKGPLYIEISGGKVLKITKQKPANLHNFRKAYLVTPGFVDIHTHGFGKRVSDCCFYLDFLNPSYIRWSRRSNRFLA